MSVFALAVAQGCGLLCASCAAALFDISGSLIAMAVWRFRGVAARDFLRLGHFLHIKRKN
ncbi:hypothetical protein [Allofranklinella schreckenbergeri]|uniref:hypothetical protein n=1 Tax=Allofranklinella schreckenbergeri TaxID=1076744 RepID=UPI0011C3A471|nr:hypothetical protein [Allofranklinella schreckenbergeri]